MEPSMQPSSSKPEQAFVEELRRRRAELRESMAALELAPAPHPQVRRAGSNGSTLRWWSSPPTSVSTSTSRRVPRGCTTISSRRRRAFSSQVDRLIGEHTLIKGLVDDLVDRVNPLAASADVDSIRDLGTALLGRLQHHRQRGSDLVYEAFEIDIGGET
jgi:hypothetical protein